ncbi:FAD binding domain-containing protein [Actinocrispum sp. NPDC049592]|uniref:FAD binding domain-containing protein n=1 Tax=Actinocrispum sp. NPDC049592 TaxID=3154835 RepID=UPI003437CABE
MIHEAQTLADTAHAAEFLAGGTDVLVRARMGRAAERVADIGQIAGLDQLDWSPGCLRIGALVTVERLATDQTLRCEHPALAHAAESLATPMVRSVATVGGNLLQRVRCGYFPKPHVRCLKSGGDRCHARTGDHTNGVCFDLGPCVAPHPSTLAVALIAHDAEAEIWPRRCVPVADLYSTEWSPDREHRVAPGEVLTGLFVPAAPPTSMTAYLRVGATHFGGWPAAEVAVRVVGRDPVRRAVVVAGGVAPIPLRLQSVEDYLVGRRLDIETCAQAAATAGYEATPLPRTEYKVELLRRLVRTVLTQLVQRPTEEES